MRYSGLAGAAVTLALAFGPSGLRAQDAAPPPRPDAVVTEEAADAALLEDALLSDEELDELVAPIALYPDSLLTQVLVASTVPLDVVKADRFLAQEKDLSDKDRAEKAETEDWDPSIQVLAGGFPTVVQQMAADIDWTEQLGDAMLAQTDDVLDAVQRQRARAAAVGNLESNEAQVVEQTEDSISIAPAQPDVVYVPQYDATTAYTTPYTAPAVIDTGISTSDVLTTGAIAFGSALLVNEIFDDDDDWDDYWDDGPDIDWDDGDFDHRPNIDIDGDVNIDRDRVRNIDRDRVDIDRDKIGDRVDLHGDGKWEPNAKQKADARERLAERKAKRPDGNLSADQREKLAARSKAGGASAGDISAKLAKREGGGDAAARLADHKPPALKGKDSALKAKSLDAKKAKAAAHRGDLSKNKGKAKQVAKSHPKAVSKAKAAHKPPKKSGAKASAMKKGHGGHAKAAKARGGKSHGGGHRGGGGGRRR
jgi:uncharacterized membrane protein YgcG